MQRFYKLVFLDVFILVIYRISYYFTHDWFSQPTLQGILFIALIVFGLVFLGFMSFFQPKPGNKHQKLLDATQSLVLKPIRKRVGAVLIGLILLTLAVLTFSIGRLPSIVSGNFDIFLFLIVFIIQFMYFQELDTDHNWVNFLRIGMERHSMLWVMILFIGLVIAKLIIIFPNAYTLIAPADGQQYWNLARQFFEGAPDFAAYNHYPPFYSLVISPAFLGGIKYSIQNISVINILLSSSIVFPVFLISKKYLSKILALLITFASLFSPYHFVYPFYPSSENLYFPLFLWILYFLVQNPKNPKKLWSWDSFTGLLIALAYLTRYQTFPLLPAFFLISWLKPGINRPSTITFFPSREKFQRVVPSLIAFGVVFSIWLIAGTVQGASLVDLMGFNAEGEGSLVKITKSFSSTAMWFSITLVYFFIIGAPVLNIFIYSGLFCRKNWSANTKHYLITLAIIAIILFITVFRHAWIAEYNYPDPHRLVTRYCIYLAIPSWIAALILLNHFENIDYKNLLLSSLLGLGLVWLGYQLFFNQEWLLQNQIVIFLYIDGHVVGFLGYLILLYIGISAIAISWLAKFNKYWGIAPVIITTIIIINLSVIPRFIGYMMNMELPGRLLTEVQNELVTENQTPTSNGYHYMITSQVDYVLPEHQLLAKGLDPSSFFLVEKLGQDPKAFEKRFIYLTIEVNNEKEYSIIEKKHLLPSEEIISEFLFKNTYYALIESNAKN